MSTQENSSLAGGKKSQENMGGRWLFMWCLLGVLIGFAVLTVAASPSLYLRGAEDTPEAYMKKAAEHVENKEYESAIEDLQKVLSYEPDRQRVFAQAEEQIERIRTLMKHQGAGGEDEIPEGAGGLGEDSGEGEEGAEGEDETSGEEDEEVPEELENEWEVNN